LRTAKQFLLRSSKEEALSNYMEIMFSDLEEPDWGEPLAKGEEHPPTSKRRKAGT
jgi:hypothetical protein